MKFIYNIKKFNLKRIKKVIIGDWGLGIGDWGLGIGDWAQSPIPNPPLENKFPFLLSFLNINYIKFNIIIKR